MDNYPEQLAPDFEESGAVSTPFEQWWPQVRASFSNVPEEVARQWLHRHWDHSPYRYLTSKNYRFDKVKWPKLADILTTWNDFDAAKDDARRKGEELSKLKPPFLPYVPRYMLEHLRFPEPIIVLDNRDGHHNPDYPGEFPLPSAYILIEGHTRLNVGVYLESIGKIERQDVWLMAKLSEW